MSITVTLSLADDNLGFPQKVVIDVDPPDDMPDDTPLTVDLLMRYGRIVSVNGVMGDHGVQMIRPAEDNRATGLALIVPEQLPEVVE